MKYLLLILLLQLSIYAQTSIEVLLTNGQNNIHLINSIEKITFEGNNIKLQGQNNYLMDNIKYIKFSNNDPVNIISEKSIYNKIDFKFINNTIYLRVNNINKIYITLYNLSGREIDSFKSNDREITWKLHKIVKGNYIIAIGINNQIIHQKIMIIK